MRKQADDWRRQTQIFDEIGAPVQTQTGGVAHIGGFVFGMLLGWFFESRQRRAEQGLES